MARCIRVCIVGGLLLFHEVRAQAAEATPVVVTVPAHRAEQVRGWLAAQGEGAVVEAAATGDAPLAGPRVLLLWDEWTLARLSAAGALRRIAWEQAGTEVDQAKAFVLPFAGDYAVAVSIEVPRGAGPGRTWEEVALDAAFAERLGIVAPEVDGSPWLLAMRERLERGDGDSVGVALWTTLDARAVTLASAYAPMLEELIRGRLAACVGPRDQLAVVVDGSAGRLRLESLAGPQRGRFGLCVTSDATTAVLDTARRLAEPARIADLARALGMSVAGHTPGPLAPDLAREWWDRFQRDVRGRGRSSERLADWLDFVFGVLFLVCMAFVWRSLRTEGPERARSQG